MELKPENRNILPPILPQINNAERQTKKISIDIPAFHKNGRMTTFYGSTDQPLISNHPTCVDTINVEHDINMNEQMDEPILNENISLLRILAPTPPSPPLPPFSIFSSIPSIKKIFVNMDIDAPSSMLLQKRVKGKKEGYSVGSEKKEKKERVVATGWIFGDSIELTHEYQYGLIEKLYNMEYRFENGNGNRKKDEQHKELVFLASQINTKKNGYRQQDIEKQMYVQNEFAGYEYIVELLYKSKLRCYYCSNAVNVLYKYVREPTQWSLERVYNDRGHNIGNVKIACLACNLRRKTMHYQRYVDTKKMAHIIKMGDDRGDNIGLFDLDADDDGDGDGDEFD